MPLRPVEATRPRSARSRSSEVAPDVRLPRLRSGLPRPDPDPRVGRFARRVLLAAGVLLALAALALIALHSTPGRRLFANRLVHVLAEQGFVARIGRVQGSPLHSFTLLDVDVSDRFGPLVRADRVDVRWRPFPVLFGRPAELRGIVAGQVDMLRPLARAELGAAGLAGGAAALRGTTFALGRLQVARLTLPGPDGASYKIAAKLEAARGALDMRLAMDRIGRPPDRTSFVLRIDPRTRATVLQLTGIETEPGIYALLLGRKARPVTLEGEGTGTLDSFAGTVVLTAGAEGRAELSLRTGRTGARRDVRVDAAAELAPVLDAAAAPLLAGVTELHAAWAMQPNGRIELGEASLKTALGDVRMRGEVAPGENAADLLLDAAGGAARYAPAAGWPIGWRAFAATGRLSGAIDRPRIALSASADAPTAGPLTSERLTASLNMTPDDDAGWRIEARGLASGLRTADPALARQFDADASVQVTASGTAGRLDVASAELRSGDSAVAYRGTATPGALDGTFDARAIQLPAMLALAGRSPGGVGGVLDLAGTIKANNAEIRLGATKGRLVGPASGLPWFDRLLDGPFALGGGVSFAPATGSLGADGFTAAAADLTLAAFGRSGAEGVRATVSVPDLGKIDGALGGAATARLEMGGSVYAPTAAMTLTVPDGTLFGLPVKALTVRAAARPAGGSASGHVSVDGSAGGEPLAGFATIVPARAGRLTLQPLEMLAGPFSLAGSLSTDLAGLAEGTLRFANSDSAGLAPVLPYPVGARAQGSIDFALGGLDGATLRATATGVTVPSLRLSAAELALDGVWNRKQPKLSATASAVSLRGVPLRKVHAEIEKRETATLVVADGEGPTYRFSGRGRVVPLGEETRIGLETALLEGSGERLALPYATLVKVRGDTVWLDDLVLRAGGGEMTIRGSSGPQVDLHLTADCVPLSLLRLVRPDTAPQGCVGGTASVTGPRAAPRARIAATLSGGAGGLAGMVDGTVSAGNVEGEAALSGGGTALRAEGSWPLDGGTFDVRASGRVDLAALKGLGIVAGDAEISGTVGTTLRVGGTLAEPRVAGRVDLANARFRSGDVDLREGSLLLEARGMEVDLARMQVSVPPRGRISGQGRIALPAGGPGALALKFEAVDVDLARWPPIRARADASIEATGPVAAPTIGGSAVLHEAALTLGSGGEGGAATPWMPPPWMPPAAVDIGIAAPDGIRLEGEGVEAGLAGELRLAGPPRMAALRGSLRSTGGSVLVGRARAPLSGGTVRFDGSPDPALDLLATIPDDEGSVSLVLGGTLSRPAMRIASRPAGSADEALSRLLAATGQGARMRDPAFMAGVLPLLPRSAP